MSLVCRRLGKVYGPVRPPRRRPVLDQLIATILSQNTSDVNSHAAFDSLKRRFGHWEAVRQASLDEVVGAIRRAGLANQ
ncbi:MAG TPA: endonuclease III, partial [Planctomycetaceae bacterium]|nr:endonuclease III [Planctomycetaceae bacterium]